MAQDSCVAWDGVCLTPTVCLSRQENLLHPPARQPTASVRGEHYICDELVQLADVDALTDLDLDVARPGPELKFGIDVKGARILRRPHVDARVREGVELNLLAPHSLGVPHDKPSVGEDGAVAKSLVCRDWLLASNE